MTVHIILTRNDPAQLYVASALAASYAAINISVVIFISGSAILAFKRDPQLSNPSELELYNRVKANYLDIIRDAKAIGDVKVIACTGVMAVYGVGKGDLVDVVDDVLDFPSLVMRIKDSDRLIVV